MIMMRKMTCVLCCLSFVLMVSGSARAASSVLIDEKIPAGSPVERIFTVKKWGRYRITAESQEGTALQLIDRKVGMRRNSGVPGEKNGRIDEFLDIGEYKLLVTTHPDASTGTRLRVDSFIEKNTGNPQYMTAGKDYALQLRDGEQASYWIHCPVDTTLLIEAYGRCVADLQLWLNGEWRIDAAKTPVEAYPSLETPLRGFRLVQHVKAGYYLCSVYGGEAAEWAKSSEKYPLYIRAGLPRLPRTGYSTVTISKKGHNNYYVRNPLGAVILARDKKELTGLAVYSYPESAPRARLLVRDSIHEKSADARCMVQPHSSGASACMVQVTGRPGDTVHIQTFGTVQTSVRVSEGGDYWVSTVTSGDPDDCIGASGVLVDVAHHSKVISDMAEVVSNKEYFSRSFNLLGTVSLVVHIGDDGKYDFIPEGVDMRIKVQPLVISGKKRPEKLGAFNEKSSVRLIKGFYRVTISPTEKGIANLKIKKSGVVQLLKGAVGAGRGPEHGYANVQFPRVTLRKKTSYSLYVNSQSPEITGTVVRKLPICFDEALPVYVDTSADVTIPVSFKEKSVLTVADAAGTPFPCTINGVQRTTPCQVDAGDTLLVLSAKRNMLLSVSAQPGRTFPNAPAKPFPTGEESPLPVFPELHADRTEWFDLDRSDNTVYEFTITKPGMYRFATLGRLSTSLTLRDRFVVNALRKQANGIGRNAMILTYLLPGTYQTIVATQGRTAGHLGLSLVANETIDGGKLTTEMEKKHEILPGQGIVYTVDVSEKAMYHIVSEGQSGFFPVRFDDADGWPVAPPLSSGSVSRELTPGSYRLISIPQQRTTLRTARITRTAINSVCKGKGPYVLRLNRPSSGVWMEQKNAAGKNRTPVLFRITLPAEDRYRVSVTEGFTATITDAGAGEELCTWAGMMDTLLPGGDFVCTVMADEVRNHADYTLSVTTGKLMKGLTYGASGKKKVFTVKIGAPGVYEFYSQGTNDVTATLLKGKKVIDVNDDAPFDWNFRITRMLMPGSYSLAVEGSAHGEFATTVKMSALDDSLHTGWPFNTPRKMNLGGKMHRIVVPADTTSSMLHVAARGSAPVSCQIQKIRDDGTEFTCGARQGAVLGLSVPVERGCAYAVYVWSVDHTDENVTIAIMRSNAYEVTLSQLKKGVKYEPVFDGTHHYVWLKMDMETDSLGQFAVTSGNDFSEVKTAHVVNAVCKNDIPGGFITLRRYRWASLSFSEGGRKKIVIDHSGTDTPLRLPLERYPRAFRIPENKDKLHVVSAQVNTGRPMCGIRTDARGTGVIHPYGLGAYPGVECGAGKTMAVVLPDDAHIFMVWNAEAHEVRTEKPDMVVERTGYTVTHLEPLVYGRRVWDAQKESSCSIAYTKNAPALITVTIPKGGIALWKKPDGSRRLFTTDLAVRRCEFQESGGTLFLVNSGRSASFSIDCISLDTIGTQPVFTSAEHGLRFENYYHMAGRHSVAVPYGSNPGGMHVSMNGSVAEADWWSGEGTVDASIGDGTRLASRGMRNRPVKGGYFNFNHDAGWVKIDLCSADEPDCRWGERFSGSLTGPRIRFSQALTLRDGVNWFSVVPDTMTQIRLQTDAPLVVTVLRNGTPLKTVTAFSGCDVSLPLVNGTYTIGCRGVGSTSLEGIPMVISLLPVTELTQKDPPEILMAAGECRMFHVTIPQKTKIGLGLETVNEVISARIYTAKMKEVGRGQQQFLDLDAGDYYLELNVGRDELPTRCIVRLVGQDVPPDNPPESLINRLMREE